MPNEHEDASMLLGIIPSCELKPEQVARWGTAGEAPTCKLLRKPRNLQEFHKYNYCFAIWQENGTLIHVTPKGVNDFPDINGRYMYLTLGDEEEGLTFRIVGKSEDAVVETVAYFMSLDEPTEETSFLEVSGPEDSFDFRAAQSQCLMRLFDIDPSRHVQLRLLNLSVEQSIALATRPSPVQLTLLACEFEDGGSAFVDALANRQAPFGSLALHAQNPLNDENMKRLLAVDCINHLETGLAGDSLLPLSANVDSLDFFELTDSLNAGVESLNILARRLTLHFELELKVTFPTEHVLPLFRRLAHLGHLVELKLAFLSLNPRVLIPSDIVSGLISTALTNCNLQVLDLTIGSFDLNWNPHFPALLDGLKDLKALRTLRISVDNGDRAFGPSFLHLRQLLSHNRYITVANAEGEIYTDGSVIDELYSLNRFYRGSAGLVVEPPSERASLVASALVGSALNDFQRSALLLASHADALHELIQFAQFDEIDEGEVSSQSNHVGQKRRRII